ncbi:hypothetical protein HQ531_11405 [bacterium]|nr:hypothetical protein [bacterium]
MNLDKLKQAEASFLKRYPGGFENPEMLEIGKKHKMDKIILFAQDSLAKQNFKSPVEIVESLNKIVSRSSMVSMFEKPKFRDFAYSLNRGEQELLARGMQKRLHGNKQEGFEVLLELLSRDKLAKWSLISLWPTYFEPLNEVFVKPTTAKGVIDHFELDSLEYKPRPSWEFYKKYQSIVNEMKSHVSPALSPNSAAFTGFLMMSL